MNTATPVKHGKVTLIITAAHFLAGTNKRQGQVVKTHLVLAVLKSNSWSFQSRSCFTFGELTS